MQHCSRYLSDKYVQGDTKHLVKMYANRIGDGGVQCLLSELANEPGPVQIRSVVHKHVNAVWPVLLVARSATADGLVNRWFVTTLRVAAYR